MDISIIFTIINISIFIFIMHKKETKPIIKILEKKNKKATLQKFFNELSKNSLNGNEYTRVNIKGFEDGTVIQIDIKTEIIKKEK